MPSFHLRLQRTLSARLSSSGTPWSRGWKGDGPTARKLMIPPIRQDMDQCRRVMLANELFVQGILQQMMEHQSFKYVKAEGLTQNIRATMPLLEVLGYIPYHVILYPGLQT